jgi:PAT family beta-lactamase induction signal transducer AmpG
MYMILVAEGENKTAHYAICTGFMALGMMIPGMWSGWLQDHIGYVAFFGWVLLATLPSVVMAALVKIPEGFGKKESTA